MRPEIVAHLFRGQLGCLKHRRRSAAAFRCGTMLGCRPLLCRKELRGCWCRRAITTATRQNQPAACPKLLPPAAFSCVASPMAACKARMRLLRAPGRRSHRSLVLMELGGAAERDGLPQAGLHQRRRAGRRGGQDGPPRPLGRPHGRNQRLGAAERCREHLVDGGGGDGAQRKLQIKSRLRGRSKPNNND